MTERLYTVTSDIRRYRSARALGINPRDPNNGSSGPTAPTDEYQLGEGAHNLLWHRDWAHNLLGVHSRERHDLVEVFEGRGRVDVAVVRLPRTSPQDKTHDLMTRNLQVDDR